MFILCAGMIPAKRLPSNATILIYKVKPDVAANDYNQMKKINEITVYTHGDSSRIQTWSNVPFFFTETLISKGIKVNRVNLDISPKLNRIYDRYIVRILTQFYKKKTYYYFRSFIHFIDVKLRIKKALKQYPNADANIFLTFSYSSVGLTKKPTILRCDWTYEYEFHNLQNKKMDIFEKWCLKREDTQIEGADLVISHFRNVTKYMRSRYKNKNIYFLGNVIHSLYEADENEIIEKKLISNNLLFVGSKAYKEGAKCLIDAFDSLNKKHFNLSLHIVGMNECDFEQLPGRVHCYGYLNKGNDAHRKLYYSLLKNAKIFINTTQKRIPFSATLEAMYFYTPVISTPWDQFVGTFGKELEFGYYCEENHSNLLQDKIKEVLNHHSYKSLCLNAHDSVKEFTWVAYIDKMLGKIEDII